MLPQSLVLLLHLAATASAALREHRLISKTCPGPCDKAASPANWRLYVDTKKLAVCPEPMLIQYNLYTPFDDPSFHHTIRACTLGDSSTEENFLAENGFVAPGAKEAAAAAGLTKHKRQSDNETVSVSGTNTTCGAGPPTKSAVSARLASWSVQNTLSNDTSSDMALAVAALTKDLQASSSCEKYIQFAYVRGTLVGLYSGSLIDKSKTPAALLKTLSDELKGSSNGRAALEVCGEGRTASNTIGAVVDTSADFAAVQKIMKSWTEAQCLGGEMSAQAKGAGKSIDIWSFDGLPMLEPRSLKARFPFDLRKRADCRSIRIESKDTCTTLASKCGIGLTAFKSFNKGLCDDIIQPGGPVCCSSGTLPDITPKPQPDGTCATYDVQMDEGCAVVASKHGLKESDLEEFNKKTWGWDGCKGGMQLGQRVCVSKGNPPMPAEIEGAACGPQKPGSEKPKDGEEMVDLNPCPLNVCCNVWGNCGTTAEFCTISKTNTNNPGTSKPGENGCQSSCGTEIVNNDKGPEQYRKIGYFEGWNGERECLHMSVLDVHSSFTHVHFAFSGMTRDHQIVIPDNSKRQWDAFIKAKDYGKKKILAFGGWAFSNEGWEAPLLREIVQPGMRDTFSDRVVKFANDNGLDGLDFDWEYPDATDIEGSPPGQDEDGANYYEFLKLVRQKLPKEKSLSIAAPAGYWYLKGFPIDKMAKELDYIVFMTYDFHGQWDVGNKWTMDGCPAGNCLRSHINATLTHDSMVMITKAGVPSHKAVLGVSSYGRSFKMADSGCRGEMCTFLGAKNQSPAKPGRCTKTGGYISNFEIKEIVDKKGAIKTWWDEKTDSDFLVYEQTEWVAYMTDTTKDRRHNKYKGMNFGGTSDWAVDLSGHGREDFDPGDDEAPPFTPDPDADDVVSCPYDVTTLDQINNLDFRNELPPECAAKYLVVVMHHMLVDAKKRFNEILSDGYDKYFKVYADYIVDTSGEALYQFMLDKGDTYFDCEIYGQYACCTSCDFMDVSCQNCLSKCNIESPWDDGIEWHLKEMRCLPNTDGRGMGDYKRQSTFWDFKSNTHKEDFYAEVGAVVGAPEDKMQITEHGRPYNTPSEAYLCMGSVPPPEPYTYDDMSETCRHEDWWHNYPTIKRGNGGFGSDDVFDPKDSVQDALDNIDITEALSEFGLSINADMYHPDGADEWDLVDGIMLPIAMIYAGLEHMEEVVEMAKDLIEAEKLSFLLNLLSAVFMVVGGAGGIIANTAFRALGRVMVIAAEAGNTGLGLYTAVTSPNTIPLLVFGLVMSGVGIRDAFRVKKAADLKRDFKAAELKEFSESVQKLVNIPSKVNKKPTPHTDYCMSGALPV